jgi:hypothetical protein
MRMRYLFLQITFILLVSCSQTKKDKPGKYQAGFKTTQIFDKSRIYKPGTDSTDYLHSRPIDIDVWYPAIPSEKDSALLFRDILGLLETRANYYTASNAGNGLSKQLAQYFCEGFKCSDSAKLLNFRTASYKNSQAVDTKFPLVVYLSAYNGMSYENYSLFEDLADSGFVVVSISSIGRYPGDMSMKKEDMMEQVYDAIVSLKQLKQSPDIDFSKIGVVGYSWELVGFFVSK